MDQAANLRPRGLHRGSRRFDADDTLEPAAQDMLEECAVARSDIESRLPPRHVREYRRQKLGVDVTRVASLLRAVEGGLSIRCVERLASRQRVGIDDVAALAL